MQTRGLRTRLPRPSSPRKTGVRGRLNRRRAFGESIWNEKKQGTSWPTAVFWTGRFSRTATVRLAEELDSWCRDRLVDHSDTDAACRRWWRNWERPGFSRHSGGDGAAALDVRSLCLIRETLARHDGLADFAFAMQGLGMGPITLFGSRRPEGAWLDKTRAGEAISRLRLSEPRSGSDVANMRPRLRSRRAMAGVLITGREDLDLERWHRRCLHRLRPHRRGAGRAGLSCFLVPADTPGLKIAERIDVIAPHPLATLEFDAMKRARRRAASARPASGFNWRCRCSMSSAPPWARRRWGSRAGRSTRR
jgi:alkylation response protein AidB-like acyl-CoA dehydrogenase